MSVSSKTLFVYCPSCCADREVEKVENGICPICNQQIPEETEEDVFIAPDPKPLQDARNPKSVDFPDIAPVVTDFSATGESYQAPQFDMRKAAADPEVELINRSLCKRHLLPFIQRFRPAYRAGWVHADICRRLERFVKQVEAGKSPRLLLMMPPRSGKSEIGSRHFPAWVLGRHPNWEIIAASHTSSLSLSFSRYGRDLFNNPGYQVIFEEARLDQNSKAVENWNLTAGGGYLAAGVGSGITGRGAHILLLDDLVKDMEAADSVVIRDNTWEWYGSTAYTRLAPGGGVLGIMCMTGDTPVLMADGTSRRLDSLKKSDAIATYARGTLASSTVAAVRSSGRDLIFKMTTSSGKIVRANQRHPFLTVAPNGEVSWTRLKNLTTAHRIVVSKDSGGSTKGSSAPSTGVKSLPSVEECAAPTITKRSGLTGGAPDAITTSLGAMRDSSTAMGSPQRSTTPCTRSRKVAARFAAVMQKLETLLLTGKISLQSTTATTQEKSGDSSATSATPESDTLLMSKWHLPPQNTSDFTLESVLSIEPDGEEEVFDVQVNTTENFIANGMVSHNTWWHDDDWAGRIQQAMKNDDEADKFEIVRYPAINDYGDEFILPDDTIRQFAPHDEPPPPGSRLTRAKDTAIHPDRYTTEMMLRIKRNLYATGQKRVWSALYQQDPAPDEGAYFTKEMFRFYATAPLRHERFVYQAWDFAITEGTQNDYTVCATVALDNRNNMYVLDVMRFRSSDSFVLADSIIDQWIGFGVDMLGVEDSQIWKSIESVFKKRCEERGVFPSYEVLKPFTDKLVRAQPLRGRMQMGKVYFDDTHPYYEELRTELLRFPAGKHDDQCFVAGTGITMADGSSRPIQCVQAGDLVLTHDGPRRVQAAALSRRDAEVHRVELSNGRVLIGTSEHPVFTKNRGWVALAALTDSDILQDIESQERKESSCHASTSKLQLVLRQLSSTVSNTVGILSRRTDTWRGTTCAPVGGASSTAMCGSITTAPYLPDTKFTTRTGTTSITDCLTLSALVDSSTNGPTPQNAAPTGAHPSSRHTSLTSETSRKRGTPAQRVLSGIDNTVRLLGKGARKWLASASVAVRLSRPISPTHSSAASRVETNSGVKTTLSMKHRSVLAQKHDVYNLTVADAHTYYASGVLVHNCDALAWVTRLVMSKNAPKLPEPKKLPSWKDKLGQYMNDHRGGSHMAA